MFGSVFYRILLVHFRFVIKIIFRLNILLDKTKQLVEIFDFFPVLGLKEMLEGQLVMIHCKNSNKY